MSKRLNVGVVTSSILVKTGFSNNIKAILPFLYKTGKYNLFHLNQGCDHNDPNLQRFPWKNWGAFKRGTFDEQRMNNPTEEPYRRFVSYGNEIIESFVLENKLDVLMHIEDIWSSDEGKYLGSKWFPYLKDNFLQWSTADSLPILPNFKNYAEKCPHMWFWSSFAEKALKEEDPVKYRHVKTLLGAMDTESYHPITKEEKDKLRELNNIDKDANVFIYLGRNQLRKLFPAALEAFGIFKKENPDKKAKLLFHCSWTEGAGWPFERLMKDFNVAREDVLTTYFCRQCGKWEVTPFRGFRVIDGQPKEDSPCRFCGAQDGQITAGITSSITNKELSKVYGIADASMSIHNSGALEYTNPQSLLCGLPLLCSEYSCGEDFVAQPFVFKLDGYYNYEQGTGFKKHAPNLRTIINFFKTICEMPQEERQKIGEAGRQWALNTFDISIIGPIIEKWLDERKPLDWNFTYPPVEPKDPAAQIPEIQDNKEWLKRMYSDILKMNVTDNDSGLLSWLDRLSKGQPRQEIEKFFREEADRENAKTPRVIDFTELLDNTGRKRFLILMKESIGDLIYLTALLKSFSENYPPNEWDLYISTEERYHEIFDANPYVYKLLPYFPQLENELAATGHGKFKGFFDGYCQVAAATQKILNYLTNDNILLPK